MANLLILTGAQQGLRILLQGTRIILGRDPKCDIVISKDMVRGDTAAGPIIDCISRKHAIITCLDGKYVIEDGDGEGHASRGGFYVNDRQVPFPGRFPLSNNDRIRICDFTCTFHEEAAVQPLLDESGPTGAQPAETGGDDPGK